MSVINTNVKSLVAQDSLVKANRDLSTSMERLSTGKRINSAKDDAAGLAIGSRMEAQSRGLNMAVRNANDGISLMQTSEGALDEVSNIMQRMRELAVQSVNGTNNDSDRVALNDEVKQLKSEIQRISTTTEFNNQKLLDGSFSDKKLQIGDKAYQTMDVSIASVQLKDLGMGSSSMGSDTMIGSRTSSIASLTLSAGDVKINGQDLGEFKGGTTINGVRQDLGAMIKNINESVDNVTASGFNTVVAKQIGNGVTTNGQVQIRVQNLGESATTTYAITASSDMNSLVDNINNQTGGQVKASINTDGKLMLSNETGATIGVQDTTGTVDGFETGSGFKSSNGAAAVTDFTGFLKLDSKDNSPIRIERGNLGATSPGAMTDLQALGFREVTSQFSKSKDAYTVTGTALDAAGVGAAFTQSTLKINGQAIFDTNIDTKTFKGKLDAINNFSDKTGVIAYANYDKTISFSQTALLLPAGSSSFILKMNGASATVTAAHSAATLAEITTAINAVSLQTGITASFDGNNLHLVGSNVQSLTIQSEQSAGTATAMLGFSAAPTTSYGSIRLDSVDNKPISIELGDSPTPAQTGLMEQNVGAADFQLNQAQLGVSAGSSMEGMNVSTADAATKAISTLDNAMEKVSSLRSKLGAMENRLTATIDNLTNIATNTDAAKSRIMDTDYSKETTALAKSQIISQAATAMLAQANQAPQSVLSLLK
jgi:flagellin